MGLFAFFFGYRIIGWLAALEGLSIFAIVYFDVVQGMLVRWAGVGFLGTCTPDGTWVEVGWGGADGTCCYADVTLMEHIAALPVGMLLPYVNIGLMLRRWCDVAHTLHIHLLIDFVSYMLVVYPLVTPHWFLIIIKTAIVSESADGDHLELLRVALCWHRNSPWISVNGLPIRVQSKWAMWIVNSNTIHHLWIVHL